jgi:hypothetical protein
MSEAFAKAFKHVKEQVEKGVPDAVIQEKMPEFRDGAVVVNRYIPLNPPMLGASLKNPGLELTKETLQTVERFAKRRGLLMELEGENIFLVSKNGVKKAWLKRDFYAATNKDLFDGIGKVVYRLNPDLPAEAELSNGLTASIARLLGDKMLITKAIVAFFFLVSPVLWIGVSMFLTESLFYPRWAMILMGALGVAATLYIIRLYLKENFPEVFEKFDTESLRRKAELKA